MCGIVGASSARNVVPILIDGIRRLEYRGYDSTGLAVINGAPGAPRLARLVSTARVADLAAQAESTRIEGLSGISHTRWATHGAPTPANAHPHTSHGEIAVVHNGIIENFEALRERLVAQGYAFVTQTDSEVIAHLVHAHWHGAGGGDLLRAVQQAVVRVPRRLRDRRDVDARAGAHRRRARREPARRRHRRRRPLPRLRCGGAAVGHAAHRLPRGRRRRRRAPRVVGGLRRARRARSTGRSSRSRPPARPSSSGPYRHFMQKEIFEQPRAVADTLEGVDGVDPRLFGATRAAMLRGVDCGAAARLRDELLLGARREAVDRVGGAPAAARSRSRASTATATAFRIRPRSSSSSRSRARPRTRWPR